MAANRLPKELFLDEYYAAPGKQGSRRGHWRSMAKYGGRMYYFTEKNTVEVGVYGERGKEKTLIKRASLKMPRHGVEDIQIFVNECGIFVYGSGMTSGIVCRLYDHAGKAAGVFEIRRSERANKHNRIKESVYIDGSVFYCMTEWEVIRYDFADGSLESCCLIRQSIPQDGEIDRILVHKDEIYLRCATDHFRNRKIYRWYTVKRFFGGHLIPLFEGDNYSAPFFFPRKGVVWMTKDPLPKDNIYREYRMTGSSLKATGRKCDVELSKMAYFDGEIALPE